MKRESGKQTEEWEGRGLDINTVWLIFQNCILVEISFRCLPPV